MPVDRQLFKTRSRAAKHRSTQRCGGKTKDTNEAIFNEAVELWRKQRGKCAICKGKMTQELHDPAVVSLDRIRDSSCRYVGNMRLTHWACNHEQRTCHGGDWAWWGKSPTCGK